MPTTKKAIMFVLISTIFTSFGQIFLKKGSDLLEFNIPSLLTNYPLIIGVLLYALSAVLYILALRYGELSIVFPLIATSFVWVSILSIYLLNESMNLIKWGGVCMIIVGVSLIGYESQRNGVKK